MPPHPRQEFFFFLVCLFVFHTIVSAYTGRHPVSPPIYTASRRAEHAGCTRRAKSKREEERAPRRELYKEKRKKLDKTRLDKSETQIERKVLKKKKKKKYDSYSDRMNRIR